MSRPGLEVGDVFRTAERAFLARWGHAIAPRQRQAFRAIRDCRTAALGGHVDQCERCGRRAVSYNSCRDRHCPKCQALARVQWLAEREAELLPVPYFHVVFTLPEAIGRLALPNAREIYRILFRAASETLLRIAADPRRLGAAIGFLAVLHTWGQNLDLHPHLHCVVPGGGLSRDHSRWIGCPKTFFLPVRVLSRLFRNKFLGCLRKSFNTGKLRFHGQFDALCRDAARREWVVYAKRPFGGPRQVLKYLARYTHRVAISNRRLVKMEDGRVTFQWKDYADGNRTKPMTLDAVEFIRRFLLHVLPKGFVRIRQYGFLANRARHQKLALCRKLLGVCTAGGEAMNTGEAREPEPRRCPACGTGRLIRVETLEPAAARWAAPAQDTS